MPKAAKEIATGLQQKGFRLRDNDHSFFHLYVNGKKTSVYTKISHGEKEIHDGLLGTMARQVRLSRKQFNELIECHSHSMNI
jgi:predicted RNA binding protein YcfA (HicA-like mRNA interferase family)